MPGLSEHPLTARRPGEGILARRVNTAAEVPTMEPSMPPRLSIRSAAKWSNVSERTLRRMVASGQLSIVEEKNGKKLLDMTELDRMGLLGTKGLTSVAPPMRRERMAEEMLALKHQCETLRQQVASLTRERDRATQQADAWQRQASQLLTALSPATETTEATRKPWWRRWREES